MSQYFITGLKESGKKFELGANEFRHAVKAARLKEGDIIFLFDSQGRRYKGIIKEITADALFGVVTETFLPPEKKVKITLCFAPIDRGQTELVLDQGTQLGADAFRFIITARTQDNLSAKFEAKQERFSEIILSAVKQSDRFTIPEILPPLKLEAALKEYKHILLASEAGGVNMAKAVSEIKDAGMQEIAVFVGPQGGFSKEEFDAFKNSGAIFATLGQNILKAETACAAVLARLMQDL